MSSWWNKKDDSKFILPKKRPLRKGEGWFGKKMHDLIEKGAVASADRMKKVKEGRIKLAKRRTSGQPRYEQGKK